MLNWARGTLCRATVAKGKQVNQPASSEDVSKGEPGSDTGGAVNISSSDETAGLHGSEDSSPGNLLLEILHQLPVIDSLRQAAHGTL